MPCHSANSRQSDSTGNQIIKAPTDFQMQVVSRRCRGCDDTMEEYWKMYYDEDVSFWEIDEPVVEEVMFISFKESIQDSNRSHLKTPSPLLATTKEEGEPILETENFISNTQCSEQSDFIRWEDAGRHSASVSNRVDDFPDSDTEYCSSRSPFNNMSPEDDYVDEDFPPTEISIHGKELLEYQMICPTQGCDSIVNFTDEWFFHFLRQTEISEKLENENNIPRLLIFLENQSVKSLYEGLYKSLFNEEPHSPKDIECSHCKSSISYTQCLQKPIHWLRPNESGIVDEVMISTGTRDEWRLVRGHPESSDVKQGLLGNCWIVCAIGLLASGSITRPLCSDTLTENNHGNGMVDRNPLKHIIRESQSRKGRYRVRLNVDGIWRIVTIDDRLPCSSLRTLVFTRNNRRQLWAPLIEKAIAKVWGSYHSLTGGTINEAFSLLFGYPCSTYPLFKTKENIGNESELRTPVDDMFLGTTNATSDSFSTDQLWNRLNDGFRKGYLWGLCCMSLENYPMECVNWIPHTKEEITTIGLQSPHAYFVLDVREVSIHKDDRHKNECTELVRLVKVRNPNTMVGFSWRGKWSRGCSSWTPTLLSEMGETNTLGIYIDQNESSFWLQWEDVCSYFATLEVCRVRDTKLYDEYRRSCWLSGRSGLSDLFSLTLPSSESPVYLDLSIHQESHVDRQKDTQAAIALDLGLVVFSFVTPPKGEQCSSRKTTSEYHLVGIQNCKRKFDKMQSLEIIIQCDPDRSTEVIIYPLSFHDITMGGEGRRRCTMCVHSEKKLNKDSITEIHVHGIDSKIISRRDTPFGEYQNVDLPHPSYILFAYIKAHGKSTEIVPGLISYSLIDGAGVIIGFSLEPIDQTNYCIITVDASESENVTSTRGSLITHDSLYPNNKYVNTVLTFLSGGVRGRVGFQIGVQLLQISDLMGNDYKAYEDLSSNGISYFPPIENCSESIHITL